MRVLLCGMNYVPNQFTRALEKFPGLTYVHISGDPGGHIPEDCDAAVIAAVQCSHAKFWAVKDRYRIQNKPVFTSKTGWTAIQEDFEDWVLEVGGRMPLAAPAPTATPAVPQTQMAQAFAAASAVAEAAAPPTQEEVVPLTKKGQQKPRYTPEAKAKLFAAIKECVAAGMGRKDITEWLTLHNFRQSDGKPISANNVGNMLHRFAAAAATAKPVRAAAPAPRPQAQAAVAPTPTGQSNEMQIMGRILDLRLSAERTVEFLEQLRAGRVTGEQALWMLAVIGELRHPVAPKPGPT